MKNTLVILTLSALLLSCNETEQNSKPQAVKQQEVAKPEASEKINSIDRIAVESFTQHIITLSSDEFGGRGPASKGEDLTINYLENEFKKAGASPGNGNSFTQKVPLASVEAINKPNLIITSGAKDEETINLSYANDQVIWSRRQIDSVSIEASEMVFVGYGINAPERNWNDYAGVDVKGKTVVMLVNDPGYATQDEQLFNGNAMTYYGRWDYKFDEAGRQGAAAALIIHDTKPAAYGWSTVENSWTGPQFDMVRENKEADLVAVEGWITKDHAENLFKKAGLDLKQMYDQAKTPGFEAVDIKLVASAAIENEFKYIDTHNVMAEVKGSEQPDEVFIYMAHWDHLGIDPNKEGDGIYNGALDNATGTAGLIELAKAFAQTKPKRTVLFLAVAAEEQGLLGSAYYAANPVYPLKKTIAGINMDGLNNFGRTKDVTVIGKGMSEIDYFLNRHAAAQNRVLKPDSESEKGYFYRSDHFELSKLGVPMSYPNAGYDHREKGIEYGIQKSEEYLNNHYHRVSDEYDPSWDLSGAIEDLQLYFLTGQDIINSGTWPKWHEGTEFKKARDEMMGK